MVSEITGHPTVCSKAYAGHLKKLNLHTTGYVCVKPPVTGGFPSQSATVEELGFYIMTS